MMEDRRCPNCAALVSDDAEWCGQCFTSLRDPTGERAPRPEPPPERTSAPPATTTAPSPHREAAFWPCTVCGAHNPIDLDACVTCGTPFATVMRGSPRRGVDPGQARTRSLLFPGAGHAALGYPVDGFARGAVFVLALAVAIFLAVTLPQSALTQLAIAALVASAVGVYVLSLAETKQLSERGGSLLVPSKVLLWGAVGVVFLIVAVIAVSIAGNARR